MYTIHRYRIALTDHEIAEVYEPRAGHTTTRRFGGEYLGKLTTRPFTDPEEDGLPYGTPERIAAVQAYYDYLYALEASIIAEEERVAAERPRRPGGSGGFVTDKEILRAARDLISDRSRWTRGVLARDARGYSTPPESPDAVRFCAAGALVRCNPDRRDGLHRRVSSAALDLFGVDLLGLNDADCHAAVLASFDAAVDAQA